jgi:protein associated with RNAse G/E
MKGTQIVVRSLNFDRSLRRSWKCELACRTDEMLTLVGVFDREVIHPDLGVIQLGTRSTEYFWFDRWYNVFRFDEPNGEFRNFYCNINLPPTLENGVLEYVDLDIDFVIWPDTSYQILDRDEFELATAKYDYSREIRSNVESTVEHLVRLIENGDLLIMD